MSRGIRFSITYVIVCYLRRYSGDRFTSADRGLSAFESTANLLDETWVLCQFLASHPEDPGSRRVVQEQNAFQALSPPLLAALKERGFDSPTDPQERLLPIISEGKNALLMAPTGTGKTEAALLPILDAIIREGEYREKGTKLLYITPLRALNRDMLDRM
ncbi:MAG: DEAD/DEAH box helicase, partial [Nitrososphaerota archaeon]|nr:DEAD/DEAH box helicase [Nitrososphaerota archaeon]